jgi:type VI secretion system protein ImpE
MTPIELFQEGKLREAIQAQDRFVLSHPTDDAARLLLCEFLLYDGKQDRVRDHLSLLSRDHPGMDGYLHGYGALLDAEAKRRRVLGPLPGDKPLFLLEPPEHLLQRVEALDQLRSGNFAGSLELLDQADSRYSGVHGHVDGRAFDDVRDGDDLFAYVLEVFIDGQYAWFPFDQIGRLKLGPRDSLRDHLYVPAALQWLSGEEWQVHLPALYPNTHKNDDEEIRCGQATDWFAEEDGPIQGVGLRVLSFGDEELTLLDFTLWEP